MWARGSAPRRQLAAAAAAPRAVAPALRSLRRRPLCAPGGGGHAAADGGAVLRRLAGVLDADPGAALRVGRQLSQRTLRALEEVADAEARTLASATTVAEPTRRQLFLVFLGQLPLFIAFGIIDNAGLIVCGEAFDRTLGVGLGISTMASAALGNLVSDVIGLGAGAWVEELMSKLGMTREPGLTRAQETLGVVRRARFIGNAVGISIGCLIGMFPLLFMDFDAIERQKRVAQMDGLFSSVMAFVAETMAAESATLFVVDQDKKTVWTRTGQRAPGGEGLKDKRFSVEDAGVVGACVLSGQAINTSTSFGSKEEEAQLFGRRGSNSIVTGERRSTVLCAPVYGRHGDVIGVIELANPKPGGPFLVKDEVEITSLSSHISDALERLFFEEHDQQASNSEQVLRAMKASVNHHRHHLRYASSRSDSVGKEPDLVLEANAG
jgi:hypothetical protein